MKLAFYSKGAIYLLLLCAPISAHAEFGSVKAVGLSYRDEGNSSVFAEHVVKTHSRASLATNFELARTFGNASLMLGVNQSSDRFSLSGWLGARVTREYEELNYQPSFRIESALSIDGYKSFVRGYLEKSINSQSGEYERIGVDAFISDYRSLAHHRYLIGFCHDKNLGWSISVGLGI